MTTKKEMFVIEAIANAIECGDEYADIKSPDRYDIRAIAGELDDIRDGGIESLGPAKFYAVVRRFEFPVVPFPYRVGATIQHGDYALAVVQSVRIERMSFGDDERAAVRVTGRTLAGRPVRIEKLIDPSMYSDVPADGLHK